MHGTYHVKEYMDEEGRSTRRKEQVEKPGKILCVKLKSNRFST